MNIEITTLLDLIERSKLSHQNTLSVNGKIFHTYAIKDINFESLMILKDRYYLVRGWIFGLRGWGYTIVFNTDLKGIYNHYPI